MSKETSLGMRIATLTLESVSPVCQSRFHNTPKLKNETHDQHEQRTWKEKAHWDKEGNMYIPPFAFKNCISSAAKYLSLQKQGKGKATWTKNFEAGLLIVDGLPLPVTHETVGCVTIHCSPDGRPGGQSRVLRNFPIVHDWSGKLTVYVADPTIPEDIFVQVIEAAGKFVGIGSFRVANRGIFGRFAVKSLSWA